MQFSKVYHQSSAIVIVGLLILFNSTIFPQQYETKYDTVDCSKYSCEQWGMNNGSCRDLNLEQWPAHCASCGQLSLYLEGKLDELDYGIYNSVLSCTMEELRCELAQELGFIPSMRSENIYHENGFSTENKTYSDGSYKYRISNKWTEDTFVYSKIVIERAGEIGYAKIGSGICGITKKISYVNNGYDDYVPGLSVGISRGDTPIATAQMIMGRLDSRLKSNYEMARSSIYDQLNNATNGWTDEDKQGAIHSIDRSYNDSRMEGMCEKDYFGEPKVISNEQVNTNNNEKMDIIPVSVSNNYSPFNVDIPLQLKKGKIYGVLSAGNVGEITGEPDLSNPKTYIEEKEEIEDQISKIEKLSKENPNIYKPELAKLYNQLYSINVREEMEGQIMDGLIIGADKSLGYIPGTATVWGVSTGLSSLVMGNFKDGIIRLTGAIPWKNFGTVFSALGDIGVITPITNNESSNHIPDGRPFQGVDQPVMEIIPHYIHK